MESAVAVTPVFLTQPFVLALAALLLATALGPPLKRGLGRLHPLRLLERGAGWLAAKLDRERRASTVRRARGFGAALAAFALAGALGFVVQRGLAAVPGGFAAALLLLVLLCDVRTPLTMAGTARQTGGADEMRRAFGRLGEGLTAGTIAPLLGFVLFGLAGACAFRAGLYVGERDTSGRTSQAFAAGAGRAGALIELLPAALGVVVVTLAALVTPGAKAGRALGAAWRDGRKALNVSGGAATAALGGALGIALDVRTGGSVVWIGGARARAGAPDISRARYLYAVALTLVATAIGAFAVVQADIALNAGAVG